MVLFRNVLQGSVNLPAFFKHQPFLVRGSQIWQVLVSLIELHEVLHDLDGVEEQHGNDKSEKDESFKLVSMSDSNSAIRA